MGRVQQGRLQQGDVACWVLKTSRAPALIDPDWVPGTSRELTRCVRRSYRLGLMAPGQPCLLWLSGRTDPGVHALGTVTGLPRHEHRTGPRHGPGADDGPVVGVRFTLLAHPLPRAALLADPVARGAEVLRMPAGSNPSWLSATEFAVLTQLLAASPTVGHDPRGAYMISDTPTRQMSAPATSQRSGRKPSATIAHSSDPATNTPP